MSILPIYMCVSGACGSQKRLLDPLELGLQHHVGAWNQTWVSIRTSLSHFFAYSIFFKKTNKEKNFHILVSRVSKDFLNYSCQKTLMLCFTKN